MRATLLAILLSAGACSSATREATPPGEDGAHAIETPAPPAGTVEPSVEPTSAPDGAETAAPSASASASAPPAATATASAQAGVARSQATAALDKIEAENGEVPDAEKKLKGRLAAIEKCVNDAGGIEGKKASLVFQFIVRAAGKIEGIDVEKSQGLSPDAVKCVVDGLKRKEVGPPSSDPVGVKVTVLFSPRAGK